MIRQAAKLLLLNLLLVCLPRLAFAEPPRTLVPGIHLRPVATHPDIVTPIGMCFDSHARLLVIESHTHQRPDDYEGPVGDRVRMLAPASQTGDAAGWSTFAEPFRQAMNILPAPQGGCYVVTRRDVQWIDDRDLDGQADVRSTLVTLDTEVEYPHNGLSGIAYDGRQLYLGLGENFGGAYRLVGSDGSVIAGRGGAGTIFTCSTTGEDLQRFATGFWNPFSICVLHDRIFTVDNDPDASPPCRLVHAVERGDYGYRYGYGRSGLHPLQAWDGELPGTLPMVCGTGEAPTAVIPLHGSLWVTSWGDHRIERYDLKSGSRGLAANRTIIVQGGADFRPTGMAVAPDGALYFGDWVQRDYAVHGAGKIWRLDLPPAASPAKVLPESATAPRGGADDDPAKRELDQLIRQRWSGVSEPEPILRGALRSAHADVRLYAVRWIADERLHVLRDDVEALLNGAIQDPEDYLILLGAVDWLDGDGKPRNSRIRTELLRRELQQAKRPAALQAVALRAIDPEHEWLTLDRLKDFAQSPHAGIRREAVRTLALHHDPGRFAVLAYLAEDTTRPAGQRADALFGLASVAKKYLVRMKHLAQDSEPELQQEVRRLLRLTGQTPPLANQATSNQDLNGWWNAVQAGQGDAAAGRRLFFLGVGNACANCHTHSGRGGKIGPDLTRIGRQMDPKRILASLLQPSQEISPRYQAWNLVLRDGQIKSGLRLPQAGDNGQESYADAAGKTFRVRSEDIEMRRPASNSIMPEDLIDAFTVQDVRDLLAFLE